MYGIKKPKTIISIGYDEPITVINPNPDLRDGFKAIGIKTEPSAVKSDNFATGSAGWRFTSQGDLEANSVRLYSNSPNAIIIDHGSDIILKEGGDLNFTSVTAPTACTASLIATTGNIDAGTHSYKITFENGSGETELGTVSNIVTNDATNQQNALTSIPVSTSGSVTSRKIYRTKAGGTDYYLLGTISDNTTTTYTDNVADASLTGGIANNSGNTSYGKIKINGNSILKSDLVNTSLGVNSLKSITTGYSNTAIGNTSQSSNQLGLENTSVGLRSLSGNVNGSDNCAFGTGTLQNSLTSHNSAFGAWAMYLTTTGSYNSTFGMNAMYSNTTGSHNSAFGVQTLYSTTTGYNNTSIGFDSGRFITDGTTPNKTSNSSVYLGMSTKALADGDTNEIVIGYNAIGAGSNTVTLGNTSIIKTILRGNVGIGTTTPTTKLDVIGTIRSLNSGVAGIRYSTNTIQAQYVSQDMSIGGSGSLALQTYTTLWVNRLKILNNGDIGIGTDTPQAKLDVAGTIKTLGYTVATLPTGTVGMRAYVTDATTPTYLGALTGGGAVTCPVFFDGVSWLSA